MPGAHPYKAIPTMILRCPGQGQGGNDLGWVRDMHQHLKLADTRLLNSNFLNEETRISTN